MSINAFSLINYGSASAGSSNSSSEQDNLLEEYGLEVIAHRGYDVKAPENTIEAFNEAAKNGYSTFECDVSWTKDSVPVILHDETINRTATKSSGWSLFLPRKCSNMTYEKLLSYDFGLKKGQEYKGTTIPTLEETLQCAKENDLNVYIELKETDELTDEKVEILVNAVKEAGIEDSITWISFEEDYLKAISEALPDARLGYLSESKVSNSTIEILQDLKTDENEVFLDIKASKMNEQGSQKLNETGFSFEAWTVDSIKKVEEMYSLGCTGITTDKLLDDDIYEYLNELNN